MKRAALLVRRPRNKSELYLVVKKGLGIHLSRKASTENHSCLLDIAWEVVSRQHLNFLIVGPRGGGKTRLVSTIEFLEGCWGTPDIFHVGAITEQAKRGYEYILEYATLPHTKYTLDGDPLLSSTSWSDGLPLEESDYVIFNWSGSPETYRSLISAAGRKNPKLSIHPGTIHQVSGGHPHFKTFDELERAKPRVVQQFTGMGREGTVSVYLSTRETAHGLVQRMMDTAKETGTPRLHFLDLWDTKAPCPECVKNECLLWDDCQGRYKDTDGHRSRQALEQRKAETDEETWAVQFCMREPGTQSLVWANFSDANLGDVGYNPDLPFELWVDDNVAAPRAIIYVQVVGNELHLFDSSYEPHQTQDRAVADVLARGYGRPSLAVVMAGDAALRQAFYDAEIQTYSVKTPFTRIEGANAARRLICDATGHRAVKIHPTRGMNAVLVKHVRRHYRNEVAPNVFGEEPAKHPEDHFPDALCYGCWYHRQLGS